MQLCQLNQQFWNTLLLMVPLSVTGVQVHIQCLEMFCRCPQWISTQRKTAQEHHYCCQLPAVHIQQVRFVAFSNLQHSELAALHQEKQPIALLGYEVKPGRQGEKDAQIFLNKSSMIQHSPRKLNPQECQPAKPEYTSYKTLKTSQTSTIYQP